MTADLIRHIGALSKVVVKKWQARSGSPYLRSLVEADDAEAWKEPSESGVRSEAL